ncbi:hypothetical protein WN943_023210 [Citrus x changshan-huyou]
MAIRLKTVWTLKIAPRHQSTVHGLTTRMNSNTMQQIHKNLQSRITQLDFELRTMLAQRYYGLEFDKKEREIRRLKYDPSKLFGMTHTLFRDNPLPPPPKPKSKPKPQPRPVTFRQSPISIPRNESPGYTPASPPSPPPPLSQPPPQSKDKEPMHPFSAHTADHSPTTDDQTFDSNLVVSDSHSESDTDSSVSTSDSEKSYADITRILMAQPDQPTQGQTSRTEPYVDIPSEVEEEMPESSTTNKPPPAQAQTSPPSQKSSNGPWFTFDDIPSSKWRDRLNEMFAWIDLQLLWSRATTELILREYATRFMGALRDRFDSLGQYRQLQFVQLPEVSSALAVIHDQFLGDPSAVFEAARRDYHFQTGLNNATVALGGLEARLVHKDCQPYERKSKGRATMRHGALKDKAMDGVDFVDLVSSVEADTFEGKKQIVANVLGVSTIDRSEMEIPVYVRLYDGVAKHWYLAIINIKDKTAKIWDSLPTSEIEPNH